MPESSPSLKIPPETKACEAHATVSLQVAHRVDHLAVDTHLEMEVRPEAVARAAHVADNAALRDGGAHPDPDRGLVPVSGGQPSAVIDDGEVAVAFHPACVDDGSRGGRVNRRAARGGNVDAGMERAVAVRKTARPERARDRSLNGPDQPRGRMRGRR